MANAHVAMFFDTTSIILVLGCTVMFSLSAFSGQQLSGAFKAALRGGGTYRDVAVLRSVRSLALHTGMLGLLIGIVMMLRSLDDPTQIGPAMAVSLLSMLYAVLIAEALVGPLVNRAIAGLDASQELTADATATESRGGAGLLFSALGVSAILVAVTKLALVAAIFDPPSVIIVVAGTGLFLLAVHPMERVGMALNAAFGRGAIALADAAEAIAIWGTARILAGGLGVAGTLIGAVSMLASMEDPSKVGPALSVAFLPLVYGVILGELFIAPLIGRLSRRAADASSAPRPERTNTVAAVACMLGVVALFGFLLLAMH